MNWGILAFVIIYEVLTVVGVGLVIARKNKHSVEEGNFALAGKGLPTAQVGVTLALTMLGSAHIWGTCENAYSMGSIATWFGIACTVMMIVITQITGRWGKKNRNSCNDHYVCIMDRKYRMGNLWTAGASGNGKFPSGISVHDCFSDPWPCSDSRAAWNKTWIFPLIQRRKSGLLGKGGKDRW